jgi:hypothetical protein
MSRSYTSSPPRASVACSGTALALVLFNYGKIRNVLPMFTSPTMRSISRELIPRIVSVIFNIIWIQIKKYERCKTVYNFCSNQVSLT